MLSVGIISTWHVHADGYAQELMKSGKVKIAALWDERPEIGRKKAAQWKTEFVEDYGAFIKRKDFSAVICGSPTTMHRELLTKAAAAGKDIFTEKLLAATTADAEAIAAAVKKAGVIFTISLPLRSSASILYIKKLVDSGELGKVTGARFRRSHSGVSDHWLPEYWFDTSCSGGGAMMDLGAHPVYLLSFLFGMPKRLTALTSNIFGTSSDENAIGLAEFEGGVLGTMETAFVTWGVPDILEVYGTEGSVFMRGDSLQVSTKKIAKLGVENASPAGRNPKGLPPEKPQPIMQFVDACIKRSGSPQYLGVDDGVIMTRITEAIYRADASGKTITF